jgi:hypothetical protein
MISQTNEVSLGDPRILYYKSPYLSCQTCEILRNLVRKHIGIRNVKNSRDRSLACVLNNLPLMFHTIRVPIYPGDLRRDDADEFDDRSKLEELHRTQITKCIYIFYYVLNAFQYYG